MLNDAQISKAFLVTGRTDLRRGIDGLASIIQGFELNPFEAGTLFLFCGRKADRIKCLVWENDGHLLLYKRLERGTFQWPRNYDEVLSLSPQQFRWLMEGLAIEQKKLIRKVNPLSAI